MTNGLMTDDLNAFIKLKSSIIMAYDVIVLGSGPGGYPAAIRASQLGFSVAIIEKESLGGICLNWGCIPTKALLKSAQVYENMKHSENYGLKANDVQADFPAVIKRSRGVADKMSKGVQFLMKKNKIDVIMGYGTIKGKGKIEGRRLDDRAEQARASRIPSRRPLRGRLVAARLGGQEPARRPCADHRGLRARQGRRGISPRRTRGSVTDDVDPRRRRSDPHAQTAAAALRTRPPGGRRRA